MRKGLKIGLVFGTLLMLVAVMFAGIAGGCNRIETDLVYGRKETYIGDVVIERVGFNLVITIDSDSTMTDTHIAVAEMYDGPEPWAGIPHNKKDNPTIGHFPHTGETGTHVVYTIPFSTIPNKHGTTGVEMGDWLAVCVHVVIGQETAWADDDGRPFGGKSSAMWVPFLIH